jgi:hypothetical protein
MKGQLRAWLNALIAVKEPEIWELTCAVCGDVRPDAKMISSRYVSKTVEAGPRWPEGEVFESGGTLRTATTAPSASKGRCTSPIAGFAARAPKHAPKHAGSSNGTSPP